MGGENTALSAEEARHLLRRSGFGAPPEQVQDIQGLPRGAAANELLDFSPKGFKPSGKYIEDSHNKWIKYMIKTKFPLQEKLVLFWHDHFATSNDKVLNPTNMARQNRLLRLNCKGNMKDLVKAINKDAAMIEFLDTVRNFKEIPNENYARELMELFTLGVNDFNGNANYRQQDIVQIARAFTGWNYEYNSGQSFFEDYRHDFKADYPDRGPKNVFGGICIGGTNDGAACTAASECPGGSCSEPGGFGHAGRNFDDQGEGPQEIDRVTDILFDHRDGSGKNTIARRTARRLFEYFGYAIPDPVSPADAALIDQLVTDSMFDTTFDIGALVRAIFVNDAFYETAAPTPFGAATKKSVKWPVDYVVSTLRLLNMKLKSKYQYVEGGSYASIREQLSNMGQILLEPPSVFGWGWETNWLSSATLLARYGFARDVTSARDGGSSSFRPERLINLSLTDPDQILEAVTDVLGVTDQLTEAEQTVLIDYLTDGGLNPTLDLNDYAVRNVKLHGLFALVLQSPAYQHH